MAAVSARQIEDPIQHARAFRDIGWQSGAGAYYEEAFQLLQGAGQQNAALAYALSDLAKASGRNDIADRIDRQYPAARAAAWLGVGQYEEAWHAASEIIDPYDRARAQAAIASDWAAPDAAQEIAIPLFRDRALSNVSIKRARCVTGKKDRKRLLSGSGFDCFG